MLRRQELHPGVVVLPNVPRAGQIEAFVHALHAIHATALDMVNTVVDVDARGTVRVYPLP